MNRLGRILGGTGLVALANCHLKTEPLATPGFLRKMYRLGEYRDSRPRDGDLGIPFPSIGLTQAAALPILGALESGAVLRGVLRPSQPNPYLTTLFGPWALIRALLICVDLGIAEAALCFLIRHMKANGVRPDLAQLALMAELFAHFVFFPLFLLDPFSSFYWGLLPTDSKFIATVPPFIEMIDWLVTRVYACAAAGSSPAFSVGATMLTSCSTLLLAAYWCTVQEEETFLTNHKQRIVVPPARNQLIINDGLASVVPSGLLSFVLVFLSTVLATHAIWLVFTEVNTPEPLL